MGHTNTNTTANNSSGENMNDQPKRHAFDSSLRDAAGGGFNLSSAADIGLKSLVAATCGVVLYKTLTGDSK